MWDWIWFSLLIAAVIGVFHGMSTGWPKRCHGNRVMKKCAAYKCPPEYPYDLWCPACNAYINKRELPKVVDHPMGVA